jgi:hypothetical protein
MVRSVFEVTKGTVLAVKGQKPNLPETHVR